MPPSHLSISSCSLHDSSMARRNCSSKLVATPKCPDNRGSVTVLYESGELAEGSNGETEEVWLGSAVSSPSLLANEMDRDSWIALRKQKKKNNVIKT